MLAVPSFGWLVQSTTMSGTVNSFMADMRYARSESIRRGGGVVMCRSDAPEAASPTCGTNPANAGWASGWIIFHTLYPASSPGNKAPGDPLLRVQAPIHALNSVSETGTKSSTIFRFTSTGRLFSLDPPVVTLKFGVSPAWASAAQRTVCVGLSGYVRVAGDGAALC